MIAWGFWWLDFLLIVCNPDNHILTLHGLWQLLNGLVFWFAFKHYDLTMRTPSSKGLVESERPH